MGLGGGRGLFPGGRGVGRGGGWVIRRDFGFDGPHGGARPRGGRAGPGRDGGAGRSIGRTRYRIPYLASPAVPLVPPIQPVQRTAAGRQGSVHKGGAGPPAQPEYSLPPNHIMLSGPTYLKGPTDLTTCLSTGGQGRRGRAGESQAPVLRISRRYHESQRSHESQRMTKNAIGAAAAAVQLPMA